MSGKNGHFQYPLPPSVRLCPNFELPPLPSDVRNSLEFLNIESWLNRYIYLRNEFVIFLSMIISIVILAKGYRGVKFEIWLGILFPSFLGAQN